MKKNITSKDAILAVCKPIVAKEGLSAVNMRRVAEECEVALGSIYNYFPSKAALITATVESVWKDIFGCEFHTESKVGFDEQLKYVFKRILSGKQKYPNFFNAHCLSFAGDDKKSAKLLMDEYFAHIRKALYDSLVEDKRIPPSKFNSKFNRNNFIDFILAQMIFALLSENNSYDIFLEMVRRTLY